MFYAVCFPISYQFFRRKNNERYLHAVSVFFGLIIPLIPIVIAVAVFSVEIQKDPSYENVTIFSGGMGFHTVPYSICTFRNPYVIIYGKILFQVIYVVIATPFLLMTKWKLVKVCSYPN